ncbi:MAG: hypothetical protein ABH851_02780 [Methanobacteriota archaeon]
MKKSKSKKVPMKKPEKSPKKACEGGHNIKYALILLGLVFLLSYMIKLHIVETNVPEGTVIDWGDVWSFLTVIETIRIKYHLPVQDLFFGGIPYVYPPISLITYAVLYKVISPVGFIFFANKIAPLIGSLAVFGIFYFTYRLTGNPWAGVLAGYLSMFNSRYMALSGIPIPEMFGHLQAPVFLYLVYLAAKTQKKNHALLAGLCGATIFLNHHLTSGVLFLVAGFYLLLLTIVRLDLRNIRVLFIVVAVSLLFSSPWWFDTINKNIMNLIVSEGESPIPWTRYIDTGGPHIIYLGLLSGILFGTLVLGFFLVNLGRKLGLGEKVKIPSILINRQEAIVLIFSWCFVPFAAIRSRQIAPLLFKPIIDKNPMMLFVFSPIYGTRFFDYIAQPFAIASAVVIMAVLCFVSGKIAVKLKGNIGKFVFPVLSIIVLSPLVYSTILYGFGEDDPILYSLDEKIHELEINQEGAFYENAVKLGFWDKGRKRLDLNLDAKNWALRSLFPDINASYEYTASLWMRDNLPEDANIITDYPAGEVVSAGSLRLITTGAELRVTVPISRIYADVITIYFTPDASEAVMLMHKWKSTHIYISDRMKIRGWFSIERMGRFPKFDNHGLEGAELEKFEESACFLRVPMPSEFDGKIWLYELVC